MLTKCGHHTIFVDMDDIYKTTKGLSQYSRAIGTIELNDFIYEFDT
jgi:hypothetical protein